jgi:hypothetical protein
MTVTVVTSAVAPKTKAQRGKNLMETQNMAGNAPAAALPFAVCLLCWTHLLPACLNPHVCKVCRARLCPSVAACTCTIHCYCWLPVCRLTASVCCSTAWPVSVRRLRQQQHRVWRCATPLGAAHTMCCGCWWTMLPYSTHGTRCVIVGRPGGRGLV